MVQVLELSKRDFKIPIINILRNLMGKVDSMREQTGYYRIKMKTIERSQMAI